MFSDWGDRRVGRLWKRSGGSGGRSKSDGGQKMEKGHPKQKGMEETVERSQDPL